MSLCCINLGDSLAWKFPKKAKNGYTLLSWLANNETSWGWAGPNSAQSLIYIIWPPKMFPRDPRTHMLTMHKHVCTHLKCCMLVLIFLRKKFGSQCKNAGFVVERINLKMKKQTIGKVFTVAENNCRMKYKIQ